MIVVSNQLAFLTGINLLTFVNILLEKKMFKVKKVSIYRIPAHIYIYIYP